MPTEQGHSIIYCDNAATTPVSRPVLEAMTPWFSEQYGNASSIYKLGRDSKKALEKARKQVADCLGAEPAEIVFTGCGTESDNWAIRGVAEKMAQKGKKHLITSVFEHHAVLHTCEALEKQGFSVTYLPVTPDGFVRPEDVQNAIRPDTGLVSVMYANNEIGAIQPIAEIGKICREAGVLFHTDAVQAVGNVPIDVKAQCIDLLSLSGHKIHAQKGIGALYVRKGVSLPNFLYGGAQERGRRGGTENLPAIVGLGVAITLACADIPGKTARLSRLRDKLIDGLLKIPHTRLNGSRENRLCGNCNVSFEGIEGESLLLMLDMQGICASSGSACTSGSLDPSHVLLALGLPHEIAHGSLRLSLSEENTEQDVEAILEATPAIVERLRAMSPLWERIAAGEAQSQPQPV